MGATVAFMPHPQTLAQLSTPTPLPKGPAWERLLFESPWMLPLLLVVVAVVAQRVFSSRKQPKVSWLACAALFALALASWIVASIVETPREALRRLTAELVEATAKADTRVLRPMLAADVQARDPRSVLRGQFSVAADRDVLLENVDRYLNGTWKLKTWGVREVQATLDGPRVGRSQVRVTTTPENFPLPAGSWWRIDWRRGPGEADPWQAFAIEPLSLDGPGAGR